MRRLVSVGTAILITASGLLSLPIKAPIVKPVALYKGGYCKYKTWTATMSKVYAQYLIKIEHPTWSRAEWKALLKLWTAESHWTATADNPTSTAYGIAQVLDTKPGTPAPQQVARGLAYIVYRYGKPTTAWAFHRRHGWY